MHGALCLLSSSDLTFDIRLFVNLNTQFLAGDPLVINSGSRVSDAIVQASAGSDVRVRGVMVGRRGQRADLIFRYCVVEQSLDW